jgi:ABC-type polysaccharide/polyol phosphate transport system ATPase subunit
MQKPIAIELSGICKKYILHHEKPTLVENIFRKRRNEEFWALRDIGLTIRKGERVGIIGKNGSGKTTLLEILAGITTPTKGGVETFGKIVSLIELEAGFHPELTGEENIYLNGLLVGMSKSEIDKRLKKIIAFADIGRFIDAPFYTYSEGMKLRLSFSIVTHTNADIVLLDENLSVGDREFSIKSYNKIREFIKEGKTIVIVSHRMDLLKEMCNRIVWMEEGRVKKVGGRELIGKYLKSYS